MSGFPVPARHRGAAALFLGLILSAPAAQAEGLFSSFFDPSPERVVIQLERSGYQIRSALLRRGDVYVCDVVDARGEPARLVVDSRDGRILERFPSRRSAYAPPRAYALRDAAPLDYGPGGRPLADVPLVPPRDFPLDGGPVPAPERHATNRTGVMPLETPTLPDPGADKAKPKPKVHVVRPKPTPSPTSEANAAPTSTDPGAATPAAPGIPAAPAPAPVATTPAPAAAAPPASSPVAEAQSAAPAPVAAPAPAKPADPKPGKKPINDLPVDPLN